MQTGNAEKKSKQSQNKLDVYSELELFFPKIPVPDFQGDCKGMPTEWWFPDFAIEAEQQSKTARAREICHNCPVRKECLDFAISFPNLQGIWGGLSPRQRVDERKFRNRAALAGKKK